MVGVVTLMRTASRFRRDDDTINDVPLRRSTRRGRPRWSLSFHWPGRPLSEALEVRVSTLRKKSSLIMRRTFLLIIAASVMTCALVSCEKRVANSPKPSGRSSSVRVVRGFVIDSARNQAIAAAIRATTAPPATAEVLDLNEDSVSDPIQLITAKIYTTVTLDMWLKGHPADRVSMVGVVGSSDDTFCRAAVVKTRLGKRPFVRSALFYIPVPPKGEQLPTDTTGVAGACELRSMVHVSADTDNPTSKALLDSLMVVIDRRLGPHAEGDAITGGGIRGAEGEKLWRQPSTSVVIATAPVSERTSARPGSNASDSAEGRVRKLFAVAYAPGSGAEDFDSWEARYDSLHGLSADDRQLLYRSVDSAAVWAGIPGLATDLKTVVAYLRTRDENKPGELRPPSIDVALIRALRAIHEGAPALPPSRRAAALVAGDIALAATFSTPSADSNSAIL